MFLIAPERPCRGLPRCGSGCFGRFELPVPGSGALRRGRRGLLGWFFRYHEGGRCFCLDRWGRPGFGGWWLRFDGRLRGGGDLRLRSGLFAARIGAHGSGRNNGRGFGCRSCHRGPHRPKTQRREHGSNAETAHDRPQTGPGGHVERPGEHPVGAGSQRNGKFLRTDEQQGRAHQATERAPHCPERGPSLGDHGRDQSEQGGSQENDRCG